MRKYAVIIVVILLSSFLGAQDARPGDAPYTPTKLEWAALELTVNNAAQNDHHIKASYKATSDGRTLECDITYDHSVSAANVDLWRKLALLSVDDYAKRHRWDWLRIDIKEIVIPD